MLNFLQYLSGRARETIPPFNKVHKQALEIFSAIHKNVEKTLQWQKLHLTADDAYRIKKEGKIAAFIGVENGYPIG